MAGTIAGNGGAIYFEADSDTGSRIRNSGTIYTTKNGVESGVIKLQTSYFGQNEIVNTGQIASPFIQLGSAEIVNGQGASIVSSTNGAYLFFFKKLTSGGDIISKNANLQINGFGMGNVSLTGGDVAGAQETKITGIRNLNNRGGVIGTSIYFPTTGNYWGLSNQTSITASGQILNQYLPNENHSLGYIVGKNITLTAPDIRNSAIIDNHASANGMISLNAANYFSNSGIIQARDTLTINAGSMVNLRQGVMAGINHTRVIANTVDNAGHLGGFGGNGYGNTTITANTVLNRASGVMGTTQGTVTFTPGTSVDNQGRILNRRGVREPIVLVKAPKAMQLAAF